MFLRIQIGAVLRPILQDRDVAILKSLLGSRAMQQFLSIQKNFERSVRGKRPTQKRRKLLTNKSSPNLSVPRRGHQESQRLTIGRSEAKYFLLLDLILFPDTHIKLTLKPEPRKESAKPLQTGNRPILSAETRITARCRYMLSLFGTFWYSFLGNQRLGRWKAGNFFSVFVM